MEQKCNEYKAPLVARRIGGARWRTDAQVNTVIKSSPLGRYLKLSVIAVCKVITKT